MASRHLIPDSQLVFSAELAAAVGLAEAVLLQQIKGLYLHQPATRRDNLAWLHVSRAYLLQLLPFWSEAELQRICDSLESLGLIVVDRQTAARDSILLAIHEAPVIDTLHRSDGTHLPRSSPSDTPSNTPNNTLSNQPATT
ncbi:MAG: hypothetical protein NWQ45_06030, partial [Congregibacter sp.]|nr:hypothetical protein [Congregibacter sp.]